MKGIKFCGECAYYSMKKHKCTRGFTAGEASESFFTDCDLPDVEIVKHGRWIVFPECLEYEDALDTDYIVCSECHHVWNVIDNCTETFKCCPSCGARMDEG